MRDSAMYARGRTLEQYCLDEEINNKWLVKAQSEYGITEKSPRVKTTKSNKAKTPDLIQLHYLHVFPGGELPYEQD